MELWDIYDADRNKTGRTMERGPVPEGDYHLVVHVCIFNSKGEMLIQQRQSYKEGWPNLWDISVGGSAVKGDSSQSAAEREVKEELGLNIAVATNCPATTANGQIDFLGLRRWLKAIETNNDSQTRGTKTQFVHWAMEGCGSTPQRCLMVGDRVHDLIGGQENGMDTAAVLYGYGSRKELEDGHPTYLCATPAQLLEAIKNS